MRVRRFCPPDAQVQLQACYHRCGEAASEKCLSAATIVRRWPQSEVPTRSTWITWQADARGKAHRVGLSASVRPAHIGRAALEGIAWRVADIVDVVQDAVPVQVLRVDGGLTRDQTLLQFQADAAGVTVQRGLLDATAAGAAALAAVGGGVWSSTLEIEERIPSGERFEPRRDAQWRSAAHADWRRFVERAAAL